MAKSKVQIHHEWITTVIFLTWLQSFSYVENSGLYQVLKLDKPLTCMIVASNSSILTSVCVQNKQTLQAKIGVHQSTWCYNLNYHKNKTTTTRGQTLAVAQPLIITTARTSRTWMLLRIVYTMLYIITENIMNKL